MPRKPKSPDAPAAGRKRRIEQYEHAGKQRINNPPVGLVTPETDPVLPTRRTYEYDPHLDPQLVWAGKKEHTSFEVPTVSLHVHERIDPRTIIEAVRRRNGNGAPAQGSRAMGPPVDHLRHFPRGPGSASSPPSSTTTSWPTPLKASAPASVTRPSRTSPSSPSPITPKSAQA